METYFKPNASTACRAHLESLLCLIAYRPCSQLSPSSCHASHRVCPSYCRAFNASCGHYIHGNRDQRAHFLNDNKLNVLSLLELCMIKPENTEVGAYPECISLPIGNSLSSLRLQPPHRGRLLCRLFQTIVAYNLLVTHSLGKSLAFWNLITREKMSACVCNVMQQHTGGCMYAMVSLTFTTRLSWRFLPSSLSPIVKKKWTISIFDGKNHMPWADTKLCVIFPVLAETCFHGNGTSYRGNQNVTISGYQCQPWHAHWPHTRAPHFTATFFPELQQNFCRNPGGQGSGPWCYTTNSTVRWEYCHVEKCLKTPTGEHIDVSGMT